MSCEISRFLYFILLFFFKINKFSIDDGLTCLRAFPTTDRIIKSSYNLARSLSGSCCEIYTSLVVSSSVVLLYCVCVYRINDKRFPPFITIYSLSLSIILHDASTDI